MPVSHVIGARSRGCPITDIQLQLLLSLDTCTWIPIPFAPNGVLMASFLVFPALLKLMERATDFFSQKKVTKYFLTSKVVADTITY